MLWIHSHVQSVKCNFSSVDVHTQFSYSKIYPNILGLVLEIDDPLSFGLDVFVEVINTHFVDPAASISQSPPQRPSGQLWQFGTTNTTPSSGSHFTFWFCFDVETTHISDNPLEVVLGTLEVSVNVLDGSLAFELDVFAEVINTHIVDPANSMAFWTSLTIWRN